MSALTGPRAVFMVVVVTMGLVDCQLYNSTYSICNSNDSLRLLLVGSKIEDNVAIGNIILGENKFHVDYLSPRAQLELSSVGGLCVEVMECSGLFDIRALNIFRALVGMAPGPYAFLYVLPAWRRYTLEDYARYLRLKHVLASWNTHALVVFVLSDNITKENVTETRFLHTPNLRNVLYDCDERYVFLNTETENKKQVRSLLQAILDMLLSYYTNQFSGDLKEEPREITIRANVTAESEEEGERFRLEDRQVFSRGHYDDH